MLWVAYKAIPVKSNKKSHLLRWLFYCCKKTIIRPRLKCREHFERTIVRLVECSAGQREVITRKTQIKTLIIFKIQCSDEKSFPARSVKRRGSRSFATAQDDTVFTFALFALFALFADYTFFSLLYKPCTLSCNILAVASFASTLSPISKAILELRPLYKR